jgi:hypothetical protein
MQHVLQMPKPKLVLVIFNEISLNSPYTKCKQIGIEYASEIDQANATTFDSISLCNNNATQ